MRKMHNLVRLVKPEADEVIDPDFIGRITAICDTYAAYGFEIVSVSMLENPIRELHRRNLEAWIFMSAEVSD